MGLTWRPISSSTTDSLDPTGHYGVKREYNLRFLVLRDFGDTTFYTEQDFQNAVPIVRGTPFANGSFTDNFSRCSEKSIETSDIATQNAERIVVCKFTARPLNEGDESSSSPTYVQDKTQFPITYDYDINYKDYIWKKDLSAVPVDVKTSASEPYNYKQQIPYETIVAHFFRKQDPSMPEDPTFYQDNYVGSCNNASFTLGLRTWDTGKVKCEKYTLKRSYDAVGTTTPSLGWIYQIDITFLVMSPILTDTWDQTKFLDAGTLQLPPGGGKPTAILDSTGVAITSPVPLNGAGNVLTAGSPFVYNTFCFCPQKDWTNIFPATI